MGFNYNGYLLNVLDYDNSKVTLPSKKPAAPFTPSISTSMLSMLEVRAINPSPCNSPFFALEKINKNCNFKVGLDLIDS